MQPGDQRTGLGPDRPGQRRVRGPGGSGGQDRCRPADLCGRAPLPPAGGRRMVPFRQGGLQPRGYGYHRHGPPGPERLSEPEGRSGSHRPRPDLHVQKAAGGWGPRQLLRGDLQRKPRPDDPGPVRPGPRPGGRAVREGGGQPGGRGAALPAAGRQLPSCIGEQHGRPARHLPEPSRPHGGSAVLRRRVSPVCHPRPSETQRFRSSGEGSGGYGNARGAERRILPGSEGEGLPGRGPGPGRPEHPQRLYGRDLQARGSHDPGPVRQDRRHRPGHHRKRDGQFPGCRPQGVVQRRRGHGGAVQDRQRPGGRPLRPGGEHRPAGGRCHGLPGSEALRAGYHDGYGRRR